MAGTLRAVSEGGRRHAIDGDASGSSSGIASAHEMHAELDASSPAIPSTVNDDDVRGVRAAGRGATCSAPTRPDACRRR